MSDQRRDPDRYKLEELEPRILLSADAAGVFADFEVGGLLHDTSESRQLNSDDTGNEISPLSVNVTRREIVFVDASIDDAETLIADVRDRSGTGVSLEVFRIDSASDGIRQITEILSSYEDLDAIHLFSHGSGEGLRLGGTWLTGETLGAFEADLVAWRSALGADADLLLYGCNLASTEEGLALISSLHSLTGADVAASDDLTGAAQLGGDWILEFTTGDIESALSPASSWLGTLVDTDGDGLEDDEEDANTDLDDDPSTNPGPDTDGDLLANYLDADDDGDGTATSAENADPNADGDPRDALDSDHDGQPDYLDDPTSASDGTVAAEQKISDLVGGLTATLGNDDVFGISMAAIGDLDGDGINDIAVGAYADDDGGTNRGAVHILFLNADGTVKAEQKISDTAGGLTTTLGNDDFFGVSVAAIGDVDGDGVIDLAVGAFSDDDGGGNRGAVYILFLNTDGTVRAEQKISDTTGGLITALGNDDLFGMSVAGIGDLDGDGVRDIAVGALQDDDGGSDRGAVYVLLLNADGTVKAEQKISDTAGGLTATLDNTDGFGVGVAGIGDLDGDSINDIVVGSYFDDDGGTDRGAVYVLFLNADGTVKAEQKISDTVGGLTATLDNTDGFGRAVAGIGDIDADGVIDIAVGAHLDDDGGAERGAVHVLFLNTDGTVKAEQKISDTAGGLTTTLGDDDRFGVSVAGIGDLDGDGAIDIAAGAYFDDDGGTDRGAVYVLNLTGLDSDGDGLWDSQEDANTDLDNDPSTNPGPDTDGDTNPNYLDADDDGDGTPTASENADPNADGDPRDALDSDHDGQPDYLDDPTSASNGTVDSEQKISDTSGGLAAVLDDDDLFGRATIGIGDLDGDGINDLAVGAQQDDDGGTDRGAIYILFLNADGTVKSEQKISDTVGGLTATLDDGDQFGASIAALGDIDGDGIMDLAVGALFDDDGGTDRGAIHVLFLNSDGTVKSEQKISDTTGGLAATLSDNGEFARSLAAIGDLDGDGIADLAVGAMRDDDGGTDRGAVHILFLNSDGTVKSEQKISDTAGALAAVLDDVDRFGSSVAGIGDLDGDGIEDIAVGSQGDDDGGNNHGAVFILFLNADGTVKAEQKISDTVGGLAATFDDTDRFGRAVAGVGDLDGDGNFDIAVGVPNDDDGGDARGAVHLLFLNANGTVKAEQKISDTVGGLTATLEDDDQLGSSVASLGDLNGDGTIDLAVGAFRDDDGGTDHGAVYVLNLTNVDSDGDGLWDNQEDANTDLDNDPSTNPGPDTDGDTNPNYLDADDDGDGTPTASENADPNADGDPRDALDSDFDGQPDYLDDPTGSSDGTVNAEQKISDTSGGLSAILEDDDRFGTAVASIGDLDGDGVGDIAVGAQYDDDGGTNRGAVYVLFLNADGTVKAEQKISDTVGGLTATLDNSDLFGVSLAGLGDIDGDGIGDIAVGALNDDDGGTNRGAVHILFLNSDGTVKGEQKISDTTGGLTAALSDGDGLGITVAVIGDLDSDGIHDIAVGAYLDDDGGADRGAVHVLFLNADGTVKAEQKISDTAGGLTATLDDTDLFGVSVTGLGDLDGDGINDIGVGAELDDDGGIDRGAVHILFLNADGTVKSEQKISDTTGGLTALLDDNDYFGNDVSGVGDLDDDGISDLAVGALFDDDGGTDRGAVHVLFLNADGTVKTEQKISDTSGGFTATLDDADRFGLSVAGIGDLDGDGAIDLAVGAQLDDDGGADRGAVYILNLDAVSSDPVITLPGAAVNFTEGDGPTVIDATATVTDSDSADFDTGTLTVDFTANSTANDRLAINDQGAGVGNISISGSDVTYDFGAGAVVIGTFAGGTDGSTPLVITFNASATPVAAQALARNITFDNVATDPSTASRTVRFVITDGDGGTSTAQTETINVSGDHILVVTTTSAAADGTTTSIDALLLDRGADGEISLEEAILATNNTANGGTPDEIHFEITDPLVGGAHTISVGASGLTAITEAVIIDGTTDSDFGSTPIIELDGVATGSGIHGLHITGGGTTIRGLMINRFGGDGIHISALGGNTIEGNYIGTDVTGLLDRGNDDEGIELSTAGNTIGGTDLADRNIISGNADDGILITGATATGNTVLGNRIGTVADGTSALANGANGLAIKGGASGNTIGGTATNAENLISGNTTNGIAIRDSGTTGNFIIGNLIGTDAAGTSPVANLASGIEISDSASGNTIGGLTSDHRNIISGNGDDGIKALASAGTGQIIIGNFIGMDITGAAALGNSGSGIDLQADGNTVGGTAAGSLNLISANTFNGVVISGDGNTVQGNYIGTDIGGTLDFGNLRRGVWIVNSSSNQIGGTDPDAGNVISGNNFSGIRIEGSSATLNVVQGNIIGLDATGSAILGNTNEGIEINGSPNNTIGGSATGARNIISGNGSRGIDISVATATGNVIQGNYVGLNAAADTVIANGAEGVQIWQGASDNLVGGTGGGEGNIIAGGTTGVLIADASTTDNAILGNDIYSNSALSIDLSGGVEDVYGVTDNDGNDADGGPNDLQNYPVLTSVLTNETDTVWVDGTLDTDLPTQDYIIEIYSAGATGDASGHGEGLEFLGAFTVTTDGSGDATFSTSITATVAAARYITATATADLGGGNFGGTSELGANILDNAVPVVSLPGAAVNFTEGDGATIIDGTATVSDSDSADFDTGTLTVDFTANSTADDRLAINDQGAGVGNISLSGSDVTYDFGAGAVVIGTIAGGTDGSTPLVITLNASATPTAVQALAQNITYDNVSQDPSTAARTVRFVVTDGDNGTGTAQTETINVTGDNDDPVLTLPGGAVNFTEGDGATIIDGAATVTDVDSADFDTGTLTIDFTANSTADDRLAINDQGAGVGNISLSGSNVTYDFGAGAVVIGSFAGGTDGSTPLVITLNASATPTAVQSLAQNITYDNVSQDPSTLARTVRFVVTDGDTGTSTAQTETINVAGDNDDPVLTLPGGAVNFTEGDGATIIDGAATVTDVDSADFDTGTLTIDFTANSTADDRLAINDEGAGVGNISLSGSDVTYDFGAGAVVIGSFAGGTDGSTPLVINLNAIATPTAVQALAQNITYDNVSQDPSTLSRTARFVVTDGDTGSSGAVTETINVAGDNDDPVLTLPGGAVNFTEGDGATIIDAGATVTDVDSADFDTGTLTVDFSANSTADDRLAINDQGAGVGNISLSGSDVTYDFGAGAIVIGSFAGGTDGSTPLVITLNASATPTAVQALAQNITYDNVSQDPSTAARTVRFVVTDGDTGTSTAQTETINVAGDNDDPVLTLPGGAVNFTEGDGATIIDSGATVTDVDSADFDTGTLTVDFTANSTADDRLAINDEGAGVGNIILSGSDVTYDFGAGAVVIGSFAGGTDGSTPLVITLNANATPTAVQALAQNITYDNVSQDPSTASRTVRFVVTDGDTGTSTAQTETINVAGDNDDPVLTLPGGAVNFTEGDGATIIDGAATVSNVDSADFDTGTLTIDFTANSTADDRLAINDQGAGVANISLSGSDVTYDFGGGAVVIGTFAGGTDGTTPLVITFNANATPIAVQALAQNITYDNVSAGPSTLSRTVRFVVTDGDTGTSTAQTETINVAAVGNDPVVTLPGGAVNFTEGDGATIIDAGATVTDADSADFDTGALTIDFTANSTADDRLAINDEGVGVGNISLSGSDVTYDFGAGAVVIGTFAGGTDGSTPLVITLNASATPVAAQALARNITYDNVSQDPSTAARTVRFVVTDGDTGTSTAQTETINVTGDNDDPVLTLPGGVVNFTEGDGATIIDAGATVTDVDSADFDTGTLTIDFTANSTADDRLAINDEGFGVGNISLSGSDVTYDFGAGAVVIGSFAGGTDGSTPLVITFNASATPTAVQALAQNITYDNVSQDPSAAARTVRFVVTDGDTGTSTAVTETINVTADNDDPLLTLPGGAVNFTEGDGATIIDAGATVSDVDSPDFDTGALTVDFTANSTADDRLSINDEGAGVGNISLSGSNVTYDFGAGAVVIGSFAGGTDGSTPLVITFDSNATPVAVQALARNITYDNVSQDPSVAARTVRFVVTDGDGGTSTAQTETINVSGDNDDPVLTLPGGAVNFTEGDGATIIDAGATVSDVDSANLDTGTLTVDFTVASTANDRLAINDQGAGVGNISLSGSNVTYDFGAGAVVIGAATGGTDGSTPLVITFNANATPVAAQALARNITFDNVSTNPSTASRTVRFVLTDGDTGTSGAVTETVIVNSLTTDPTVLLPGSPVNFRAGDGPTIIDATTVVSDLDSPDFSGGALTVDFTAGATANDRLAVRDQGAGSGNVSRSGSNVTYDFGAGAVVIGAVAGGTDGATPLVVSLNSSSDAIATQALARNITFDNVATNPIGPSRTVRFVVTDGDGGTSSPATQIIDLDNRAPIVTGASFSVSEDAPFGSTVGIISASDPDPGDQLTFAITSGNTGGAFQIDPTSGMISVDNPAILNGATSFALTVVVVDDGVPSQASQATVIVNVDPVETPDDGPPDDEPDDDGPGDPDPETEDPGPDPEDPIDPTPETPVIDDRGGPELPSRSDPNPQIYGDGDPPTDPASRSSLGGAGGSRLGTSLTDVRVIPSPVTPSFEVSQGMLDALDIMSDDLESSFEAENEQSTFVVGSIEAGGIAFTAGVVAWLLRAGSLVSAFLSSMPLWMRLDPLPVLDVSGKDRKRMREQARAAEAAEAAQIGSVIDPEVTNTEERDISS